MKYLLSATLFVAMFLAACGGGGGGGASAPPDSPLNPTGNTITAPPGTPSQSNFEAFNAYTPDFGLTCTTNPDNSCMAGTVRAVASGGNVRLGSSTVTDFSDNHLDIIGASAAYARGATGQGERVVVIDSGIDQSHREFPGDKVAVVTGIGDSCSPTDAAAGNCANAEHGTAVAAIVAGARGSSSTGVDMHGVAFDAKINFIPITLRGDSQTLPPLLHLNGYSWEPSDRNIFDASANYRRYIAQGKILNLSFGRPWAISEWQTLGSDCGIAGRGSLACYRYYYQPVANVLAQSGTRAADRSIIVQIAHNYNSERHDRDANGDGAGVSIDATSPIADALLPHVFSELEMGHYVVVAVGADGEIADYSNRCGVAANFCIAAPGGDGGDALSGGGVDAGILSATTGNQYSTWQGTSFAAPIVSGALAIMRSFFRNSDGSRSVGNTELVNRLLATANRNGRYATSSIYGRGLLDLDAATRPMGPMMTASGAPLAGTALEITRGAFSDAMARALNGKQMAVFDQLGTPFFRDADGLLRQGVRGDVHSFATVTAGSDRMLQLDSGMWIAHNYNGGRSLGLLGEGEGFAFSNRNAFAAPFFSLVQNGLGAGFSGTTPSHAGLGFAFMHGAPQGRYGGALGDWKPGTAVALNYRPRNIHSFSVQAGVVREAESFLGARPGGGMGAASGDTVFAGVGGEWQVGRAWHALLAGFIGQTKSQTSPGLLRGVSDLRSSAFSIGLWRRSALRRNDWLGFRLSQPMRVESGRANLRLATARTRHGEILYDDIQANLKPEGRALEAEAAWQSPTVGGDLSLGLKLTHSPEHNPVAGTREFVWARFRKAF